MPSSASDVLDALGDSHRRQIVEILHDSPMPVRAIADQLPISRPAVSRHLKLLKRAGLVMDEPQGTRRVYRLQDEGLRTLQEYLDAMWRGSLQRFAKAVESEHGQRAKDR